jgi:hypothetical protein
MAVNGISEESGYGGYYYYKGYYGDQIESKDHPSETNVR